MTENRGSSGGLFEKLLLPGYADAGANVTFRPISSDQCSDAATEKIDNTTIHLLAKSRKDERDNKTHHPFFPSTDASLKLQQQHQLQLEHQDHEEKKQQQIEDDESQNCSESPRPQSPPTLSRRQMPARSVAGTSTVPETGGRFDPNLVNYRQTQLHERGTSMDGATSRNSGGPGSRFHFYPPSEEFEVEDESHNSPNKDGKLHEDDEIDSGESQVVAQDRLRQLSLQDQMQRDIGNLKANNFPIPGSAVMRDTSLFERDSDIMSDVNSTASEMGTVINIGANAARMAEIEEMAALVEASPYFDGYAYGDTTGHEDSETGAAPAMPILENSEGDGTSLFYDASNMGESSPSRRIIPPYRKSSDPLKGTGIEAGASAVVSAAIRRIGSGLNSKKFHKSSDDSQPLTAPPSPGAPGVPPTPRREDLLNFSLNAHESSFENTPAAPPPTFALRSPGSVARQSLSRRSKFDDFTPKFSYKNMQRDPESNRRKWSEDENRDVEASTVDTKTRTTHAENNIQVPSLGDMLPRPFQFARTCMSFDSTLDENPLAYHIDRFDTAHRQRTPERPARKFLGPSMSWDVDGAYSSLGNEFRRRSKPFGVRHQQDAFRSEPSRHSGPAFHSDADREVELQQRARLQSDFSPTKMSNSIELQTPQRIEIEREDALDILACLVERGVAFDQNDEGTTSNIVDTTVPQGWSDKIDSNANEASIQSEAKPFKPAGAFSKDSVSESEITNIVEELRMISEGCGRDSQLLPAGTQSGHDIRMAALDELVRSHSYALEMKRAALSASAWLKSIGRSSANHIEESDAAEDNDGDRQEEDRPLGVSNGDDLRQCKPIPGSQKIEILSLKALLHTAQMEAKEKAAAALKLDEELSKCRAEIGRLRSAARTEATLLSHDKSILDDDTESGPSTLLDAEDSTDDSPSPIPKKDSDADEDGTRGSSNLLFRGIDGEADQLDALVIKAALEQANNVIRDLHAKIEKLSNEESNAPTVDIPDVAEASSGDDNRMVNVRMLDGENFVTEWDDLTPPLPPPPDHGLRSPIVHAVLEQWTTDRSLHDSLLGWMERVMSGHDLESVPPLTISSLDHQVRDGFSMHVLPLLLRRADIHVAVQTRAHRRTTYDMAVTVNPTVGNLALVPATGYTERKLEKVSTRDGSSEANQLDMDEQSNATELAANLSRQSPATYKSFPPYRGDDVGDFTDGNFHGTMTSYEHSELSDALAQQQGIMGALGGALGGLLSRRKYSAANSPSRYSEMGMNMPASMRTRMDLTASPVPNHYSHEDDQPYHRVVSAPPGRIGMTFVEFRGHAMVSDVANDSPLSGWVFPSDVLIAIDEVPVSGMRVRDIVKVLTTRKNRQRALRVISSHAMNEFTGSSSASEVG